MTQDWSCVIAQSNFKPESDGLYLVLMHVNLQPAHLVLLNNETFYSLTNRSVDIGRPFENLEAVIIKKSIPCLFIQLNKSSITIDIPEALSAVFKNFQPLNAQGGTCLRPVSMCLERFYGSEINAQLIFDVLCFLETRQFIVNVASLHIPKGKFILKSYSIEDVNSQIRKLLNP